MKRVLRTPLDQLKQKYTLDQLKQVLWCRDDIRGLVAQDRAMGYDDADIEARMGDYLDEVYDSYQQRAESKYGLSEEEFEQIYTILEGIEGRVSL